MAAPEGYLAVDVGGTKLAAGVVDLNGVLRSHVQAPTPETEVWESLKRLVVDQLTTTSLPIGAVGVGCGGPMILDGEHVSPLNISDWREFPLRKELMTLTQLPVHIANDAQAIVLGESWCGAACGKNDVLGMVVSTGVGGGMLSGGRLVTGRLGNAGHIGHVIVEPDGRLCTCGARGCLEAYASGPSIAAITGNDAALAGPEVIESTGRYVGLALASVAALMDLDLVVIGGSVALGFGDPFFAAVRREVARSAKLEFSRMLRVVPVGLGAESPLIGAAAVARSATIV